MALAHGGKACIGEGYMDPMTTQCDNDEWWYIYYCQRQRYNV